MNLRLVNKLFPKRKPSWASLCSLAFTDRTGVRYYRYNDELDMNIIRKGEIEKYLLEFKYGSDIEDICQGMKNAISASDKKGNMHPDITTIGYLIQEIADRKGMLILPDILFAIIATAYIREDENPALIDQEIFEQKAATFKNEIQHGGLFSFFQSSGLMRLLGLSGISIIDFNKRTTESLQRIQNLKRLSYFSVNRLQHG